MCGLDTTHTISRVHMMFLERTCFHNLGGSGVETYIIWGHRLTVFPTRLPVQLVGLRVSSSVQLTGFLFLQGLLEDS